MKGTEEKVEVQDMRGVLIVEDQCLVALDLEHIVASAGYPVIGIVTARAEIESLAVPPRIAFIDINLRDGPTGVEIARTLSERFGTQIIFVTANPAQIDRPPPTAIGFIQKPFRPSTIENSIGYALGSASAPPRDLQVFAQAGNTAAPGSFETVADRTIATRLLAI